MKQYNYFTWLIPHFTWLGIYLKLLIPHRKLIRVNNICCEAQGPCGRSGSPSSGPKAWARCFAQKEESVDRFTDSVVQPPDAWFNMSSGEKTKPNQGPVDCWIGQTGWSSLVFKTWVVVYDLGLEIGCLLVSLKFIWGQRIEQKV